MKMKELINKHADHLSWNDASIKIDINQIDKQLFVHLSYFWNWKFISACQKLSEDFIDKYRNYVDWGYISIHQKLSEKFILNFPNYVDWNAISCNQNLSKEFIENYLKNIKFLWSFLIKNNPNIDKETKNILNL